MKTNIKIIIFLAITTCLSCSSYKYVFETKYPQFGNLSLDDINAFEKKNSIDVTRKYSVSIGESIYPNKQNFILEKPKTFKKDEKKFTLETEYYYSKTDNSIKVILYQWDELDKQPENNAILIPITEKIDPTDKYKLFQKKFNELSNTLTALLGDAKKVNLHKTTGSFRDDMFWSKNNRNAYLFMFGNDNGYRQIRLAVYSE